MASATVGALRVVLSADSAAFSSGLKQAEGRLDQFGSKIGGAVKALAAVGVAAAAAGAAIAVGIKRSVDAADDMSKAAQKVGIATEELSKLKYAADLSGVSFGNLQTSMIRLSRSMSDTAKGTGEAKPAFDALNISIQNTDGSMKSSSVVLDEIAAKFAQYGDGVNKTALAVAIFGRAGADMIPLLNAGASGIEAMKREAELFGLVISTQAGKQAEAFNDNLSRLGSITEGVWLLLSAKLLPALEGISAAIVTASKETNILSTAGDTLAAVLRGVAFVGINVSHVFQQVSNAYKGLTTAIGAGGLDGANKALLDMENNFKRIHTEHQKLVDALYAPPPMTVKPDGAGGMPDAPSLGGGGGAGGAIKAAAEQQLAQIEQFRQGLLTLEEAEIESYTKRLIELDTYEQKQLDLGMTYAQARERIEAEHQAKMADLRRAGMDDLERFTSMSFMAQADQVTGSLAKMTRSVANESRAMFEVHRAAGIADAIVSGIAGVSKTLGAYPFPLNVGMAAAHAGLAAAQVAKLASTSFNSKSGNMSPSGSRSAPSSAGAGASTPGAPGAGGESRAVHMTINGSSFSRDQVREMLESVGDYLKDGGKLVLA